MTRPSPRTRFSLARASRVAFAGSLGLVALGLQACGASGGLPGIPSSMSAAPPAYRTVEEAQQALAKAERDLDAATMHQPVTPSATGNAQQGYGTGAPPAAGPPITAGAPPPPPAPAQTATTTPQAPPMAEPKKDAKPEIAADESKAAERASSPCDVACRAYSSMRKAAEALCRLAGDTDPRCTDAQKRVNDSATRVASCGCDGR